MSPKVPEAYLKARRAEIVEAALKCFIAKGFHNTTMQDIYDATDLSPGAVYNYFSSKEDIIISVFTEHNKWILASVSPLISEKLPESLVKGIDFWISLIKKNEIGNNFSITLDYYSEATRNPSIHEAVIKSQDEAHEKFIEIIKHNQQIGFFNPKLDPLAIARLIGGILFGIAIHKMLDPEVDVDAYGEVCAAIFNGTFSRLPRKPHQANKLRRKRQDYKE